MNYNFILLIVLFVISVITAIYISIRIKEKYEEQDKMLVKLRNTLQPIFPDMNNVILLSGTKSYTINKKRIHLCLKDEKGDYYDINMLIYVLLHELAHVRCDEIGHTYKFFNIFNDILSTAQKHNLYDPTIPIIKDYCEYSPS
jgi:hypothetical protein